MSSAKILIVEDEGLTAMELQRKLQYWGYEVPSFVFSGREAIKKVKEINPDLIIMDIVLKGKIDGIDAAKEIIKDSKAPIIYLTAHGDEKTYERAMMTKHAAYILKPYDESELHRIIETTIYKNNLTKKLEKKGESVNESLKNSRGVIITDDNGYVHYINWEASKLTGWKKEKALNRSLKEILKIEDLKTKTLLNTINNSQEHVESSIGYSKLISADKTVKDIEYNLEPIKDEFGDFLGYSIIFQDITDIKRSNELDFISESYEQFKSIYSNSQIPSGLFESNGKLVDVNKSFMGLIREDDISKIKEMNLFDIFPLSSKHKNDLKKGKTIEYEINSDSKNINFNLKDETNTLKIIVNPLFLDEDLIGGYLIQMQDIKNETPKKSSKKSENQYKELFNNIDDIYFELDSKMNILFWNKAAEEFTKITSKQALGEQIFKLLPNLKDPELVQTFDKALKNNEIGSVFKKFSFKEEEIYLKLETYPSEKGISVIIKDFTEFEKDKKDLKKIQGFYRNLIDEQNDMILRCTLDGNITYANHTCLKNFGKDIVGKDMLSIVTPDDRNTFKKHFNSIINDKKFKNIQTQILNLENQVLTVEWTFNPVITNEENFSEIQAVGRNISHFIESEQNLTQDYKKLKKDLENEIKTLNDINQSLKVEIHKLEGIKNDLSNENLRLKSDLDVLVKDFDEERSVFNSRLSELESVNRSLVEENSRLADVSNENLRLKSDLDVLVKDFDEKRAVFKRRLSELEDKNKSITKENATLNKKYDELFQKYEKETNKLKTKISNLKQKNDSINEEFNLFKKHSEKDIESYINENEDLRTEIVSLRQSKSKLKQEYSDIKEKLEKQLEVSKKLNKQITEFKNKEKLLKEEIEGIKSKFVEKLLVLENDKENMANEISELKKDLKSVNELNFWLEEESKKHLEEFKVEKDVLENKIIEINSVKDSLSKKIKEWELRYYKDLEKFQKNEKFLKEFILNLKDKNSFLQMKNSQLDARLNSKLETFIREKKELKRDIKKLKDENKDILNVINDKNSLINDMNLQINDNLKSISHLMDIQWEYLLEEINNKFRNNRNYIDSLIGLHEISKESDDLRSIDLSEYLKKMLDNLFISHKVDTSSIKTHLKINNITLDGRNAFNCGLIINELVLHSIKQPNHKGLLEIEVVDQNDSLKIRLNDNRVSVPKDYHNLDSISFKTLKNILKQLNGSIKLSSDSGAEFIVEIPK